MKRNKVIAILLFIFLCIFSISQKKSFGIYKQILNTKVYLSVLDPSSNVFIRFESEGGSSIAPMNITANTASGPLPTPTRENYNFLGWYKDNGVKADPNEPLLADVTYYAHWAKIVCKKVTSSSKLHTETCLGSSGCLTTGTGFSTSPPNNIITYGTIFDSAPTAGDAYDCDVDNDGVYDPQDPNNTNKYTERFYFVRQKENTGSEDTAVMLYYTSFDDEGAIDAARITASKTDETVIHPDIYSNALTYLPTSQTWDNPDLVDLDGNGKITRLLSIDDIESVCGSPFNTQNTYFTNCQKWFFFENSRFQASNLGRSGIWVEVYNNNQYYRIQTSSVALQSPDNGANSKNTARPVIEVPITSLEGYQDEVEYTINFNTHGGSQVASIKRYSGQAIGTFPTTTREHYNLEGWYANYDNEVYTNQVTPQTIVTGSATYHAKWIRKPSSTVTFNANGGTVEGESTLDVVVDTGDAIETLPVPVWAEHSFLGWYKTYENGTYSNQLSAGDTIDSSITVYAKWGTSNYVARIGNVNYETLAAAINAVPSNNTKTKIVMLKDITLTEAVTIPSGKWAEFDIGNYTISGNISLITNNGKLDIINGTIEATLTPTTNTLITNGSGATINISGGTLINRSSNGTKEFLIVANNGGTVNITGGDLHTYGQSAGINNNSGTLNVSGGTIIAHSATKGQAIYVAGGIANISGDCYIENTSGNDQTVGEKNTNRAAVDNSGGIINITGGTIVSKGWSAFISRSDKGTTTIGTDDGRIDISTPVMRGKRYGLERTSGTVSVYDGIFEAEEQTVAVTTDNVGKPEDINWKTDGNVLIDNISYHTAYLLSPTIIVNFFPENGDSTISITVNNGDTIGTQMPSNPTKTGYYFDGWYDDDTLITSQTEVTNIIDAHARWVQSINNATIESTLSVEKDSNKNISITGTDIESVTYLSNNDNIATVDATGKVTGVAIGSATITITGTKSNDTKTVTVTVTPKMHTVTFLDSDNQTEMYTREVEDGTSIGAQMPANPTKDNYVFNAWYIGGNPLYEFTSANVITGDVTVVANWKEKVTYATLTTSPSPLEIEVESTGQINLSATSQNGVVEDYTFTSGNSNVATVNQSGVVTGVAIGNTDITITGSMSGTTTSVHVVVNPKTYTVTFKKDTEEVITSVQVQADTAIGNKMPANPTKENYIFDTWYINGDSLYEFTNETIVRGNMVVVASWSPNIQLATIPASITVVINRTNTISVTGPSGMEGYTFSSANNSIATVDNSGTVTGVALGTTSMTITGTRSQETRTVEVTVSSVPLRIITFMDDDNTTVIGTAHVEDGKALGTEMPANPTKENYIFNGWYINGDSLYPFTSSTEVSDEDITVVASWKATIAAATVTTTPDPLRIMIGNTGQISITEAEGRTVEGYTISSSNTSVASITNTTVHGQSTGTVTITITGTESSTTKTVHAEIVDKYKVTFEVDDDTYSSKDVMPNDPLGELPTPPTKSGSVFVGWYTTSSTPYTTRIDEETIIDSDKTYYARWESDTYHAEMNNELYTTVQLAVNAAPTSGTATIRLLKDVTYNTMINLYDTSNSTPSANQNKNIVLDLNNFSITNSTTYTLRTKAVVEIKNGTIIGSAGSGALETNESKAKLTLRNVNMTITGTRQAIYNDGGTINIYGGTIVGKPTFESKRGTVQNEKGTMNIYDANISSSATGSNAGAAVTCRNGTLNIYGGTYSAINSNTGYGIYVTGGTLTIGTKDNKHDTSKITIQGKTNGVNTSQNIKFYDGIIKAISTNNAINNEEKISDVETNATITKDTENISGVDYNRLYYVVALTKYRINFNANGGTVSPEYKDFNLNEQITALDLPTPTKGTAHFDGWYTDTNLTQPFASFTPSAIAEVTYHAKWSTYVSTLTPVTHTITSEAMTEYFGNISSWVPDNSNNHETFMNHMNTTFTTYSCSACNGNNNCDTPSAGTYCDQPNEYVTGVSDDLNVYIYENNQKGSLVTYTTSDNGIIYNMIPGKTYYWESKTDNTVYGVVTATGERRTLKTSVRNLRDLGGMPVSYTDLETQQTVSGTIDYGRLYRGAEIKTSSGVTELNKLGITREIDLRIETEGNHTYKLSNYDIGTSSDFEDIIITNYHINPVATPYLTEAHIDNYRALKAALRKTMEYVVAGDNIFFHCTIGTDRTGTLAYFLEGLLGVSEENRLRDYELTYFFGLTNRTRYHDNLSGSEINPRFESMYKSYPTNQDIYNFYKYEEYVPSEGEMTDDELITAFRNAMIN